MSDFITFRPLNQPMRYLVAFFLVLCTTSLFAQDKQTVQKIAGTIVNDNTMLPVSNVNIININKVKGTVTNGMGYFEIEAAVNDTLHISSIGFQSLTVRVTNDWVKNKTTKIQITQNTTNQKRGTLVFKGVVIVFVTSGEHAPFVPALKLTPSHIESINVKD